jgi:hypothetical protein
MKNFNVRNAFFLLAAAFCGTLFFSLSAEAQRRDYLTEAEIELVRDAQQIDLRVQVLTKAIDRRLLVLKNDNSQTKQIEKDSGKWGELPQGTRTQLLADVEKILQKAIDDIDDVAARNMDSKFFPKAVFKLTASCQAYIPQFRTFYDSAEDEKQRGAILGAIENCNAIIEASAKVPKETPKEEKKKKTN